MDDIFISYSQKDRAWVKRLVDALTAEGYKVWWDLEIRAGESFDEAIETTLEQVRCVVVVWSQFSVKSEWVRAESAWAKDRGILVSIQIEQDIALPLKFYHVHTEGMVNWKGSLDAPAFRKVVADIRKIVGPPPSNEHAKTTDAKAPSAPKKATELALETRTQPEPSTSAKATHEPHRGTKTSSPPSSRSITNTSPFTLGRRGIVIGSIALVVAALAGSISYFATKDDYYSDQDAENSTALQDVDKFIQESSELEAESIEYDKSLPDQGSVQSQSARVPLQRLKPAEPQLIPFTVKTTPEGARVRILNIGPKYRDGIELKPGRYRIEATLQEYRRHLGWHKLTAANPVYVAELEKIPAEPPTPAQPVYSKPTASQPPSTQPSSGGGQAGQTWREPVTGMEFAWVPEGCYRMGSNEGDDDEKPVHEVCVDGYWLGKYEVTQGQWEKVMGSNPAQSQKGDDHPVEKVSWNDVQDYIRKLNNRAGAEFRLPTEAEWEYACRSGGKDEKYSGGNSVGRVAWSWDNSGETTHRVGTKAANGLGLHDMSGNVWEWVQDIYSESAYSSHRRNNPVNTGGGSYRVYRGGGRGSNAFYTRCANRRIARPGRRNSFLGFRLLRK